MRDKQSLLHGIVVVKTTSLKDGGCFVVIVDDAFEVIEATEGFVLFLIT